MTTLDRDRADSIIDSIRAADDPESVWAAVWEVFCRNCQDENCSGSCADSPMDGD